MTGIMLSGESGSNPEGGLSFFLGLMLLKMLE